MEQATSVIDRVFTLLETLAYAQTPLSLSEIIAKTGFSKTTTHRLLQTLLEKDYVAKNTEGKYTLGVKYIELASYHINSLELQAEANPFLSLLYSQLNLSVHMGVLEGFKLVYVTKLDLYPTTKTFAKIGYETPAYCSSIGKILLSMLSGQELSAYLNECAFTQFTANTITNPQALKAHLRAVRAKGWAMDNEEYQLDHRCIAVPIYNYSGVAIAGMGVSGTKAQLADEKLPAIVHEVQKTAEQISKRMGYS